MNKNSLRASALPEEDDDFIKSALPMCSQSCSETLWNDVLLILCIKALNLKDKEL